MLNKKTVDYYRTYAKDTFRKHPCMFDNTFSKLKAICRAENDGYQVAQTFGRRSVKLAFALLVLTWDKNPDDINLIALVEGFVEAYPPHQKLAREYSDRKPRKFPVLCLG